MKALLAGMGAGGVVGVVGLAIGLAVVPQREPAAVRGAERPTATSSEGAATEPDASTIFADEPSADDRFAATAPVQAREEPESISAPNQPAEDGNAPPGNAAAELEEGEPVQGGRAVPAGAGASVTEDAEQEAAAELAPAPGSTDEGQTSAAAEAAAALSAATRDGPAAAELAPEDPQGADKSPDAGDHALANRGDAASLAEKAEAFAEPTPAPAVQTMTPAAPEGDAVEITQPEVSAEPAPGLRNESDARPAAPDWPDPGAGAPAFVADLPPPPKPLPQRESSPQVQDDPTDSAALSAEPEDARPALIRNAAAEPPPAGIPMLALILVDRPEADLIDDMPLTVAIAADAVDAGERADAWRAAGAEIVAIPGLPDDADGTGPLALFDATFEAMPQAAAVMAEGEQGFASGPVAADEIAATLADTGHGVIIRGRDRGPLAQAAEKVGVPVQSIFRRVDGSGRDGRAIGRFLDQAAFEARNRGAVVVIADNTPETAEGIERFLGSSRADTVALVPVSAILRSQ